LRSQLSLHHSEDSVCGLKRGGEVNNVRTGTSETWEFWNNDTDNKPRDFKEVKWDMMDGVTVARSSFQILDVMTIDWS
jgi:hypothetical protein